MIAAAPTPPIKPCPGLVRRNLGPELRAANRPAGHVSRDIGHGDRSTVRRARRANPSGSSLAEPDRARRQAVPRRSTPAPKAATGRFRRQAPMTAMAPIMAAATPSPADSRSRKDCRHKDGDECGRPCRCPLSVLCTIRPHSQLIAGRDEKRQHREGLRAPVDHA